MQDKPFALVGVNINCYEPAQLKDVMNREQLSFRSFTDAAGTDGLGVIGSAWNLTGTPTIFVLDHKGVIRFRWRGITDENVIYEVLNKLLKEAEGDGKKSGWGAEWLAIVLVAGLLLGAIAWRVFRRSSRGPSAASPM